MDWVVGGFCQRRSVVLCHGRVCNLFTSDGYSAKKDHMGEWSRGFKENSTFQLIPYYNLGE